MAIYNNFLRKPHRLSSFCNFILIILSAILILLSTSYTTKRILNDNKFIFREAKKQFYGKPIEVEGFIPLYSNGTKGPITTDRTKDDGTKINFYDIILNDKDNKLESFYNDDTTLSNLEENILYNDKYMCEKSFGLTNDMGQGYEISCPPFYHLTIDYAFWGRYAHDDNHCIVDFKNDTFSEDTLSKFKKLRRNCGKDLVDMVRNICQQQDKSSCIILPVNNILKETCSGYVKYLHVKYHCTKDEVEKIKIPKIAVVMYANNVKSNSLYENSISEFYQYCDIHNYTFIYNTIRYDISRDLYYMKLYAITEALIKGLKSKEYDWIL